MKRKSIYLVMALVLALSLVVSVIGLPGSFGRLPTASAATTWYEQSTSATTASGVLGSSQNCQTFTPAVSHYFDRTSFLLYRKGSTTGFTLTIALYNVDPATQKPVSPALCSTTFDASSLSTTAAWYEIAFAHGYPVSAGTQYAIVLSCSSGNLSNLIYVRCKTGGSVYGGGLRALSGNGGASWTIYPDIDLAFKEGRSDQPLPSQWYVATTGSDTTGNGSPGNPWQTIQFAIDNSLVLDGSTINVAGGTYNENVVVNKPVTVQGAGSATTTISGVGTDATIHVVQITADGDVTFDGFTVENPATTDPLNDERMAIRARNGALGTTYTISNNKVVGTGDADNYNDWGIYGSGGQENLVIAHNEVSGHTSNAVCIENHTGPLDISYNTLNCGLWGVDAIFIMTHSGNDVSNLQEVSHNTIDMGTGEGTDAATGISVCAVGEYYGVGVASYLAGSVEVTENDISNLTAKMRGIGFWCDVDSVGTSGNIISPVVSGNRIAGASGDVSNSFGMDTIGAVTGAVITNNTITGVDYAFYERAWSGNVATDTELNSNTFGGNTTGVVTQRTSGTLDAENNWWGDPSGPSGVGPGTGDPVSANVDYDPWTVNHSWYVATTGSDSTGDGSQSNPWQTVGHAVASAYSGDTIMVADGTYNVDSTIVVNKALTISGPVAGGAIVQGTNSAAVCVFELAASNVVLENMEVTHNALPPYVSTGWTELSNSLIRVPASLGVTGIAITGSEVYVPAQSGAMSTWNGVAVCVGSGTTTDISITGNTIHNTRNGVVVQYNNTATISGNSIYDTKGGVMNYTNSQADADNRTVSGNSWSTTHNEWDIVWNTAYYVPDYQQSVLVLSAANNDGYVLDRRAADAAACAALTGNRSHIFVDDDGTQSIAAPAAGNFNQKFTIIGLGVAAVVPGGTVYVGAGTYTEQVTITKSLHLIGEGIGSSVIQAPGSLPAASDPASAIVLVSGSGVDAELTGFTVTGPGPSACGSIRAGIYVYDGANADIHHNLIQDIRDSVFSGCQNGVAISVGRQAWSTTGTATITYNTIVGYQKGGIVVDNAGSAATVENNVVTGAGTTDVIGQNGIQISRGATATLSGNTVTGNSFHLEGSEWDWCGAGILLYESGVVTLSGGNTVSNNDQNLYIYATTGAVTVGAESLGPTTAPVDYGYDIVNLVSSDLDATDITFVGAESDEDVETLVWHKVDDAALGQVTWTPVVTAPNGWYEQYATGGNNQSGVIGGFWPSQSFTPATSHTVTAVSLQLYKVGSPTYTVTISLYAAGADDKPMNAALCSTTFLASSLTTTAAWYEYQFSAGYAVAAGTKYAIVLSATEGAAGNLVYWRLNTAGTYAGGMRASSTNKGESWTTQSAMDFMFREGQNPPVWYEQYATGANNQSGVIGGFWLSQSFTPATSHTLNAVSFQLYKVGSPTYTVTISLYAADTDDKPMDTALCSTTFLASSLTTTATWFEYQFSTGYGVVAGTKYAIVLSATEGAAGNLVYWRLNTAGTYSRGMRASSTNKGESWTTQSAMDLMFREGGSL